MSSVSLSVVRFVERDEDTWFVSGFELFITPFQDWYMGGDSVQGRRDFVACPWLSYCAPLALRMMKLRLAQHRRLSQKLIGNIRSRNQQHDTAVRICTGVLKIRGERSGARSFCHQMLIEQKRADTSKHFVV